ncbi:MAG TPA: hypothetical protein VNT24_07205, partial [Propionibacteriaceae bacterium]|nr:hypothetical protein [Propionibacteriaceae bacterium]
MFVANGHGDPMILPHFSYLLAGLIPQARVKIYPDAAHGFLFRTTPISPATSTRFSGSDALGSRPGSSLARRWSDSANLVRTTHSPERRFHELCRYVD